MMEPLSGNCDDKTSFRETIEQMHNDFHMELLLIVRCTLMHGLHNTHLFWIYRVPETLKLARNTIQTVAPHWP
jgi:transposase